MTATHLFAEQPLTFNTAGTTTQWHKNAYVPKVNILNADKAPWIGQICMTSVTGGIGPVYGTKTVLITITEANMKNEATENQPKQSNSVILDLEANGNISKK